MKTIEFIVSYLRTEANQSEKAMVRDVLRAQDHPPLETERLVERLMELCKKQYNGINKLHVVKLIKDITGWGLKESKDWGDKEIFPQFENHNYGQ